jgi:hypothetical protein
MTPKQKDLIILEPRPLKKEDPWVDFILLIPDKNNFSRICLYESSFLGI